MTRYVTDVDEVLNTTRTVRFRMDFDRHVEDEVLVECLELAQQATVGSNQEYWKFILVRETGQKEKIAALYRQVWEETVAIPLALGEAATVTRLSPTVRAGDDAQRRQSKILDGVKFLVDRLEHVPVVMIACSSAPPPRKPLGGSASGYYGSIIPFVWSFQLALRSRGMGSVMATAIVHKAEELKTILDLPDDCNPITMVPIGYTKGLKFKKGARRPIQEIYRWDRWSNSQQTLSQ